jgi:hypothetical protein
MQATGRAYGRIFAAGWAALFALAVFGVAAKGWLAYDRYERVSVPVYALGLRIADRAHEIQVRGVLGTDGDLAKVRPGDRIVAVDGRPAPAAFVRAAELAAQLRAAPGPRVTVRLRAPNGASRDVVLVRSQERVEAAFRGSGVTARGYSQWLSVFGMLALTAAIVMAALLRWRAPHDRVATLFAASCLMMAAGGVAGGVTAYFPVPGPMGVYAAVAPALAALGWCGFLFATLIFPAGRLDPKWTRGVALLIPAWGALYIGESYRLLQSPIVSPGATVLFLAGVAAQIARYRRLPPGVQRQQIRWALFGFALAVAPASVGPVLGLWQPAIDGVRASAWVGLAAASMLTLSILPILAGLVVSLARYRLYDADMVISRSAGYAILTLALGGVWAGAEKTLEVLFEGQFGHEAGAASAGAAAALAARLVSPGDALDRTRLPEAALDAAPRSAGLRGGPARDRVRVADPGRGARPGVRGDALDPRGRGHRRQGARGTRPAQEGGRGLAARQPAGRTGDCARPRRCAPADAPAAGHPTRGDAPCGGLAAAGATPRRQPLRP